MSETFTSIYMGTPEFAVAPLRALCAAGLAPSLVVTQPSKRRARRGKVEHSAVGKAALELGLPLLECEKISRGEAFDQVAACKPDLIIVVAFGQILRKSLLALPKHGCVNLHPSMLPKYRGAAPIQQAIIEGQRDTGITVMRLVKALDAGPVLLQKPFQIGANENAAEALERSSDLGSAMIVEVVEAFAKDAPPPDQPQDDAASTYAHMLAKDNGAIYFGKPAQAIHDLVCGVQPWPGAFTTLDGAVLKIHRTEVLKADGKAGEAGTIVGASKEGLDVACGEGVLRIYEVQAASKPRRKIADFLNGSPLSAGDRLGDAS